jgi:hypothetical protein
MRRTNIPEAAPACAEYTPANETPVSVTLLSSHVKERTVAREHRYGLLPAIVFADLSVSLTSVLGPLAVAGCSASHCRELPSTHHKPSAYGGGERDRTDDLLLAKQALSQLSYTPR